jgi:hypothetical protein
MRHPDGSEASARSHQRASTGAPKRAAFARLGWEWPGRDLVFLFDGLRIYKTAIARETDCQMLLLKSLPHPLSSVLLQTKVKLQFDRTVTDRSKAFFRFVSASNRVHFFHPAKMRFYFLANTAQGAES